MAIKNRWARCMLMATLAISTSAQALGDCPDQYWGCENDARRYTNVVPVGRCFTWNPFEYFCGLCMSEDDARRYVTQQCNEKLEGCKKERCEARKP